ncbi:hypothetical protein L210DRAFT_3322056, partial [Boletus edulis BED1]
IGRTNPTRNEALQAALLLRKHMVSWDDPFARKLEAMLGSFGHRTRAVGMRGLRD